MFTKYRTPPVGYLIGLSSRGFEIYNKSLEELQCTKRPAQGSNPNIWKSNFACSLIFFFFSMLTNMSILFLKNVNHTTVTCGAGKR